MILGALIIVVALVLFFWMLGPTLRSFLWGAIKYALGTLALVVLVFLGAYLIAAG